MRNSCDSQFLALALVHDRWGRGRTCAQCPGFSFMNQNTSIPDAQGNRPRHRTCRERRNCLSVDLLVIVERASSGTQEKAEEAVLEFGPKSTTATTKIPNAWLFTWAWTQLLHGTTSIQCVLMGDSHYKTLQGAMHTKVSDCKTLMRGIQSLNTEPGY